MKSAVFFLALPGALAAILERAACNADNCARAVTGTFAGPSRSVSRLEACNSFQAVTAYPAAVTTTTSSGSTTTTIFPINAGTTVTPTSVPNYIFTACTPSASAISRFQSACSCASVTRSTSTAPAPTVTVVVPVVVDPFPQFTRCGPPYINGPEYQIINCDGIRTDGGETCYCHEYYAGGGYCTISTACDRGRCETDADCVSGDFCSIRSFCNNGAKTCLSGYDARICHAVNVPSRLFRKSSADEGQVQRSPPV